MPKFENHVGDCREVLGRTPSATAQLVLTSPPYADARKKLYGGPHPDKFVEWFMPIVDEIERILKPDGTFILNIKERVVKGERHTYALETVLEMRRRGWLWTEDWCWHKRNCAPGKWPNRFRDSWERIFQFNRQRNFLMNQNEVMVPIGDWAANRLKNLSATDKRRDPSKSGSSFGKNVSNWLNRNKVYPTNVLHLATECGNKRHPAAFPPSLPNFFIRLFSNPGGTVADPFQGSGTVGVEAVKLQRCYIGIDQSPEYTAFAEEAMLKAETLL